MAEGQEDFKIGLTAVGKLHLSLPSQGIKVFSSGQSVTLFKEKESSVRLTEWTVGVSAFGLRLGVISVPSGLCQL